MSHFGPPTKNQERILGRFSWRLYKETEIISKGAMRSIDPIPEDEYIQ